MAEHPRPYYLAVFVSVLILAMAPARADPNSHVREEVFASYFYNGTLSGQTERNGYIEVDVGNTADALQYINLTLTSTEGTNLNSRTAYRNVAASPNLPTDRTLIFVNTTNSSEDLSYQITNQSLTPVISMRLFRSNLDGGEDLHPGANAFLFNVTLNASSSLSAASLTIQARRNTFGMNDSIDFLSGYASSGSVVIADTDFDGFNDKVSWAGGLPQGEFNVSFEGTVMPGVNFDESFMQVSLDESQTACSYAQSQAFTGIAYSGRFSRGPIREGVEMIQSQSNMWIVRAFMKNIASDLRYVLHRWELYEIGNPVPVLSDQPEAYMGPDREVNTGWYDTGLAGKPAYYSGAFDWEVVWGTSTYAGTSTSMMMMPDLYEIDSWSDGYAILSSNSPAGRSVLLNITTRHLGYSGIYANSFRLNFTLPGSSMEGEAKSWAASAARVYYSNGSGTYEITPYAAFQAVSSGPGDGFAYVSVEDIFSALGHYMRQNDDIIVSFIASSPASGSNKNYNFTANTTLVTVSGTPVTKTIEITMTAPGVLIPSEPGGGGGGGAGPSPFADIVRESADAYFVAANMVNAVFSARIIDSGDKGIKDVKVMAYVPKGAELDPASARLRIYRNSTGRWEELVLGRDFSVADRGLTKIGEDEYREYLLKRITPFGSISELAIDLKGGDRIETSYKVKVPFGTSYLLTRIFGYNYYEDKLIFEDAYIPVRREADRLEKLQTEESDWMQGEAVTGKSVRWKKLFRVYNPNNVSVEETAVTGVFQDSMSVEIWEAGKEDRERLALKGGNGTTVSWHPRLGAGESKNYIMEATTPPVLETKREVEVIESSKDSVKIIVNMTLENFAMERYRNVSHPFPVKREKILAISDPGIGIEEYPEGTRLVIESMGGFESRNISIMYVETPPLMVTTLSAIKYSCADFAAIKVIIVPSEAEANSYLEVEVAGPEPHLVTMHSELVDMSGARPYQEATAPINVRLSSFPSGKYFVYTKFRRNFEIILSDVRDFSVDCPERDFRQVSWIYVLGASLAIVAFLALRVYRKRGYEKETRDLRKKVRGI